MAAIKLRRNSLLRCGPEGSDEYMRVLHQMEERGVTAVIDIPGRLAKPFLVRTADLVANVESGALTFVASRDDPFMPRPDAASFASEAASACRDGRVTLMAAFVATEHARIDVLDPGFRWATIEACSRETGVRAQRYYSLLTRWWQRGQCDDAFLPDLENCGAPGKSRVAADDAPKRGAPRAGFVAGASPGVNVCGKHRENIVALALEAERGIPLRVAYVTMMETYYLVDGKPRADGAYPTYEQFSRTIKRFLKDDGRSLPGPDAHEHNLKLRPRTGTHVNMATGPGELMMVDATVTIWDLVRESDRFAIMGPAVVYFAVDVYSNAIIGAVARLSQPNREGAKAVVANAFCDKDAYCARLGIADHVPGSWPMRHLTKGVFSDRGPEWLGDAIRAMAKPMKFSLEKSSPYDAPAKGQIEAKFGKVEDCMADYAPGIVRKRDRGPKKPNGARWTLAEFNRVLVAFVQDHNRSFEVPSTRWPPGYSSPDGLNPTPNDLWAWGKERSGNLEQADEDLVWQSMLPRKSCAVSRQGIHLGFGLFLEPSDPQARKLLLSKKKGRRFPRIEIAYDEDEVGRAWLVDDKGKLGARLFATPASATLGKLSLELLKDESKLRRTRRNGGRPRAVSSKITLARDIAKVEAAAREQKRIQARAASVAPPGSRKASPAENRRAEQAELATRPDPQWPNRVPRRPPSNDDVEAEQPDLSDLIEELTK